MTRKLLAGALAAPVAAVAGVAAAAEREPRPGGLIFRAADQQVISAVTSICGGLQGPSLTRCCSPCRPCIGDGRGCAPVCAQYIMKNNPYTAATGLAWAAH